MGLVMQMPSAQSINASFNQRLDPYVLGNQTIAEGLNNFFTGNADFNRNLYMSNSAYQRAAQDLQSVGLNPYALTSNGASPASSPASHSGQAGANLIGTLASFASGIIGNAVKLANTAMIKDMKSTLSADRLDNALAIAEQNNATRLAVADKNNATSSANNTATNNTRLEIANRYGQTSRDVANINSASRLAVADAYINARNGTYPFKKERRDVPEWLQRQMDEQNR